MLEFLCTIGWHNWTPWYYVAFGMARARKCKRCKKIERETLKEAMVRCK